MSQTDPYLGGQSPGELNQLPIFQKNFADFMQADGLVFPRDGQHPLEEYGLLVQLLFSLLGDEHPIKASFEDDEKVDCLVSFVSEFIIMKEGQNDVIFRTHHVPTFKQWCLDHQATFLLSGLDEPQVLASRWGFEELAAELKQQPSPVNLKELIWVYPDLERYRGAFQEAIDQGQKQVIYRPPSDHHLLPDRTVKIERLRVDDTYIYLLMNEGKVIGMTRPVYVTPSEGPGVEWIDD